MTINSSNSGTKIGCLAGIGRLPVSVLVGWDLHVRRVVARAPIQARPHMRPAKPRVE
ncbi:MAG: hypothetical protein ACXWK2_08555 [Rhizomicrobium sp.]